jgi:predicted MFS family arabinose efflux permease
LSSLATIAVLFRWRRPPRPPTTQPTERLFGATLAGLRYVRFSPQLRALLARSAIFVVSASALWALLPVVARQRLGLDSSGYGLLLACLGIGAVGGAFGLPRLRSMVRPDVLVAVMTLVFGLTTMALGWIDSADLARRLALAGLAWLTIMSSFNVAAQTIAPACLGVLGTYLLVSQGGLAIGSFIWGSAANQPACRSRCSRPGCCVWGLAPCSGGLSSRVDQTIRLARPDRYPNWAIPTVDRPW